MGRGCMTRYRDYVPLFTAAEKPETAQQCTSCGAWIKSKNQIDAHVDTEHHTMDLLGYVIKLNDIWWRKRGT
jgi:hypothetical protein